MIVITYETKINTPVDKIKLFQLNEIYNVSSSVDKLELFYSLLLIILRTTIAATYLHICIYGRQ